MAAPNAPKAARCDNGCPMPGKYLCQKCARTLCKLCVSGGEGREVCASCGSSVSKATEDELRRIAERQTAKKTASGGGPANKPSLKEMWAAGRAANEVAQARIAVPPPPAVAAAVPLAAIAAAPGATAARPEAPAVMAKAAPAAAEPRLILPPGARKPPYFCEQHPQLKATRRCEHCIEFYCNDCAKMVEGEAHCRSCGGTLVPLLPEVQGLPPRSAAEQIRSAFLFPLKGSGPILLILGAIFLFVFDFLQGLIGLIALCYMYTYLTRVCRSTACGRETPPPYPSMDDMGDALSFLIARLASLLPACVFLLVYFNGSFGGALSYVLFGEQRSPAMTASAEDEDEDEEVPPHLLMDPNADPVKIKEERRQQRAAQRERQKALAAQASSPQTPYLLLRLLGDFYMPMLLLALILFRNLEAVRPGFIALSVAKVWRPYLVTYFILASAEVSGELRLMLRLPAHMVLPIIGPWIADVIFWTIWLYLMMVQMRALGELYFFNQKKLGWFQKEEAPEPTSPAPAA